MSVAKGSELSAASIKSFDAAIAEGIAKANKTLRNVRASRTPVFEMRHVWRPGKFDGRNVDEPDIDVSIPQRAPLFVRRQNPNTAAPVGRLLAKQNKNTKALKLLGAKTADNVGGEPRNHFFSSRPQLLLSASFIYIYRTRSRGPAAQC
jgi:flavin-binding protein dodecin